MRTFYSLAIVIAFSSLAFSQSPTPDIRKIEASPDKGFSYPYYLFVPSVKEAADPRYILVSPNNTGSGKDDLAFHEANVKRRMAQVSMAFGKLDVPFLMPVFPRPEKDWKIYTHALDRDSMITEKKEYARFDLQMIAMIDDARKRLAEEKITTEERVLIYGFSAAGMFTNRFTFLHPHRVLAAAVGSPGGWPIAPVDEHNGKKLRYPIGTADLKSVAGKKIDLGRLRKVRFMIFLGEKDDNDSLIFGDGYEPEDKELVFELFGKTPIERWELSKKLYTEAGLNAEFKLYPAVGHTITPAIIGDVNTFFASAMKR